MREMRKPKHARRLAYRLAMGVVRRNAKRLDGVVSPSHAKGALAAEIAQARARFEAECPAPLRGQWFDEAFDWMIDRAYRGLPIEMPKAPVEPPKPRKRRVEPLPDLPPIVEGGYREAPREERVRKPRGPLVADTTPKEPLFPYDPSEGPRATIKFCGLLLLVGQGAALVWALGSHVSSGSYLAAVILLAALFGTPILIARSELAALSTPSD